MRKEIEMGTRFGSLKVVEYLGSIRYQNSYLCECDCGKTRKVILSHLLNGIVKHCGCENFLNKHGNKIYGNMESSYRAKASNYKSMAKIRKIEFTLSISEIVDLLKGNCFYCGREPSNKFNVLSNRYNKYYVNDNDKYNILYNGIDRVDNNIGYVEGNVVSCCNHCNTAKLNRSLDEFKEWVIKIYNNLIIDKN